MPNLPGQEELARNEHIGPGLTGDNIDAKRMAAYGFDGTQWHRIRVPTGFHSAAATASGATTLWTPATGKRFRIMGYDFQITGNATQSVAGLFTVTLLDGATDIQMTHSLYVPSAAGQSLSFDSGWHNFGNGYLSLAVNNVLSINLSATLTAGTVRVNVMGCDE